MWFKTQRGREFCRVGPAERRPTRVNAVNWWAAFAMTTCPTLGLNETYGLVQLSVYSYQASHECFECFSVKQMRTRFG
jgi:hypothetical protein